MWVICSDAYFSSMRLHHCRLFVLPLMQHIAARVTAFVTFTVRGACDDDHMLYTGQCGFEKTDLCKQRERYATVNKCVHGFWLESRGV